MANYLYRILGRNVLIGFASLLLVIVALSSYAIIQFNKGFEQTERIRLAVSSTATDLNLIRANVANLRRYEKDIFININSPDVYEDYFFRWQGLVNQTLAHVEHLKLVENAPEQILVQLPSFESDLLAYQKGLVNVVTAIRNGSVSTPQDANQEIVPYKGYVRGLDSQISEMTFFFETIETGLTKQLENEKTRSTWWLIIMTGLALLIALAIGSAVFRSSYLIAKQMHRNATTDPLTGWNNRYGFRDAYNRYKGSDTLTHGALIYLDLDQFKLVNDVCGHQAGDQMLKQLCGYLDRLIDTAMPRARLAGDEFAFLLTNTNEAQIEILAQKLIDQVRDYRFVWQGRIFNISGSVGVKLLAEPLAFDNAIGLADAACFIAKDQGRNQFHILKDESSLEQTKQQMDWAIKITQLIESGKLALVFQKIPNLRTNNEYEHCEVLLRTIGDDGTLSLPANLIPAAERFSMMAQLDKWVISAALADISRGGTLSKFKSVGINLSGKSIADPQMTNYIMDRMREFDVDPSRLCFEITETAAIGSFEQAELMMRLLKHFGCTFALDDFGTGLSSFGYLKKLDVDYLKIDGMFVKDVGTSSVDNTMVKSLVDIAATLSIKTIAECIEDEQTAAVLRELGIDYGQGYLFHKPEKV